MTVTQARLDRYRSEIDAYGNAAAVYVEELLRALMAESPDMTVADIRDEAIEAVDDALNAFGDQASTLALDLLEETVAAYGMTADTVIEDAVPHDMIEGAVRYRAIDLAEGRVEKFVRDVADLSRYYIHRSAFENMERNCMRNDLRYARVPSGRETCGFCFMLSSRGFVYRSEQTAGSTHAYHDHCDCVIVPGFKDDDLRLGVQIEGYDPDGMADRWGKCLETIGGNEALRDEWDALDDKAKARYKGNTESEQYRRFYQARVIAEVETRDFRWLNTNSTPRIDTSAISNKKLKALKRDKPIEWSGYEFISENGVKQSLLYEDQSASANIDFAWHIAGDVQYWELKTPRGDEWSLVKLLDEGYSKWVRLSADGARIPEGFDIERLGAPRMVVDNRYSDLSDEDAKRIVAEQMNYLSSDGDFEFSEAMVIGKDGSFSRIKRK